MYYVKRTDDDKDSLIIFTDDVKDLRKGLAFVVEKWRISLDKSSDGGLSMFKAENDNDIITIFLTEGLIDQLRDNVLRISSEEEEDSPLNFRDLDLYLLPSSASEDEYPAMLAQLGFYQ